MQRTSTLDGRLTGAIYSWLGGMALLLCLATRPAAAADIRLGNDVVPTFQAISLELDADQAQYRGTVWVDLEVLRPAQGFLLHSEGHEFQKVLFFTASGEVISVEHEKVDSQTLSIKPETVLAQGKYTLEIEFSALFGTRAVGLYRMEQEGLSYAFTQFQPDDAREAFPCWDEPGFKIPYKLTVNVPAGHLAVSNTPVIEESTSEGWRTFSFKKTRPLPTYLLAIATGPLETFPLPGLGVPGRIVTVRGQSHLTELAIRTTPPLLRALEGYFGTPYPYEKLDFIAVPEFWPGAMENAGAITFSDNILLLDTAGTSVKRRRRMATVISHELAHQWFGNMVTMKWWDDLWLNESFANWMGDKISAQIFPELGGDLAQAQAMQEILTVDARATTDPIHRPVDSAENLMDGLSVTYQKGTAVLNMMERWLGPEPFRQGIRDYLQGHVWSNAEAADLWKALDESSGKKVSGALATFIDQAGHPLITVTLKDKGQVTLSQQRFRNYGASSPDLLWQVPVDLKYPVGDKVTTQTIYLEDEQTTVSLELPEGASPPDWILPHAGAIGFYRWQMEPKKIHKMAAQASELLTPRERIGLLGNVGALLEGGMIRGDDYLAIVGKLANDPDPLVVDAVISALGNVEMAFIPAKLLAPFDAWILRILSPALDRFGLEKQPGESEEVALVRPRLITWLGTAGRDDVARKGRAMAESYMKGPTSIDPSLVGTVLRLAGRKGDRKLLQAYQKHFEETKSPVAREQFLDAFGTFNHELRQEVLAYVKEGGVRPDEIFAAAFSISTDIAGRELVYRWFIENYDELIQRLPPTFVPFVPNFADGCSPERLRHATEFFSHPSRFTPEIAKRLSRITERVNQCVELRQREGEAVARFLTAKVP